MRKVAIVAVSIAVAGLAGALLLARVADEPPTLPITYGDIMEIDAYPVPEGPPAPPLVRHPNGSEYASPLANVRDDIPSPFPAPVQCDYSGDFGSGLQLTIKLRDGRRLEYFSCAFPPQLHPLLSDAFSARSA